MSSLTLSHEKKIFIFTGPQANRNEGEKKKTLKSSLKKLQLNSQKRPGTGSGSGIIKNAGSGSALNQCRSETLVKDQNSQNFNLRSHLRMLYTLYATITYMVFTKTRTVFPVIMFNLSVKISQTQHLCGTRLYLSNASVCKRFKKKLKIVLKISKVHG